MIELSILRAEDWRAWRELRLQALAEAPYAFGSTLAEWQGAGDTQERWRNRLISVPFNVIAKLDGAPAGMIGATAPDHNNTTELISLWVAPFARGHHVGDALVQSVIEWSQSQHATHIALDVVASNEAAIRLYRRHGFVLSDDTPPAPNTERRMLRML